MDASRLRFAWGRISRCAVVARQLPRSLFPSTGRRALALAGVVALACVPHSEPIAPEVTPHSTLDIAALARSRPKPFSVAYAAPQGATSGDPSVHVVFSQAARSLGGETPTPEGISLSPEVAGHWEWVGDGALTFVPDRGRLPRATSFEVTVPARLKSARGEELAQAESFQFQTPLPRVVGMSPPAWERSAGPRTQVVLELSQPVTPGALAPFLSASSKDGPIELSVLSGESSSHIRVLAQDGWPLDRAIKLRVSSGWVGTEGPLGASAEFEQEFETYGPLTASVECRRDASGRCLPGSGLSLRFSNPVPARTTAYAVRGEGAELDVDRAWDPDVTTRYIGLGAQLHPRQTFTVVVGAIQDVYGQPLKWIAHRQVDVADYPASVRVGFSGDAFLPEQKTIAIHARNSGYDLALVALQPEQLNRLHELPQSKRFAALLKLPGVKTQKVSHGKLNEWAARSVPLADLTQNGLFAVGVRFRAANGERSEVRWGQRTDLAVTVKSGRDRAHAWVTRLSSGQPLSGARLQVVGQSKSSMTDASGLSALPAGSLLARPGAGGPAEWLEVRLGDEVAYRSTEERIGAWRLPVSVDFWDKENDLAMLFPERDLFRPGQSAWVKGYLRRPVLTGTAPSKNQRLFLDLSSPTGEVTQSLPVTTNDYGAVAERVHIPASAQLGYWTLRLRRGEELLTTTGIQVAEYRPTEFEVKVQAATSSVVAGEAVRWKVDGSYLEGGAMAGAPVETTLRRERTWFSPPGFEGHITDDSVWQQLEDTRAYATFLESHAESLSALGTMSRTSSSTLEQQTGPERLEFEATVTDVSAQTASARSSVLVHPAAYYPVIESLPSRLVDAPASVHPRVLAVTPEGQRLTGRSLSLSLHRVRWTHVKSPGSGGASGTLRQPKKELIARCQVTTGATPSSCPLKVPYSGEYIVRATAVDKSGREVSSSLSFYALGGGGNPVWRDMDEQGVVQMSADREVYQPGQTARILVQSPFEKARAWVTVERNGVIEQRVESLSGPSPSIQVAMTPDMMPNAYVGVHLIEDRGALGARAHTIADSYRFGYVELRLDPEQRRLTLDVETDKDSYRPRDQVQLQLAVRDRRGESKRSEVAVFVIDEGVLSLSGYELPDPLLTFLRPRPLRVETIESRESMARVFGFDPNQDENKGDPGGGGDGERANMLTTAYFNPSVLTDADGRAQVRFTLPDNIGRFRVMAVAVSEDDFFGTGRAEVTVNQPLMLRPALPRFLRAGDRFEAATAVSGLELKESKVDVSVQVAGAELLSAGETAVFLGDEGSALASFEMRAKAVGEASFLLSASAGKHRDALRVALPVRSPAQLEAVALYGKTQQADGHRLGVLQDVRHDMGQLDVTLSSSALVGLEGGFEQLWDYPYLCSEQLSSRALPLLMLRDFAQLYGIEAPKDAARRIEDSVGQLIRRQHGDGGFGMWPESPESSPWVSAYVLWVLSEAQERGVAVPRATFELGVRYLSDLAAGRKDEQLTQAAFASFVMSRLKHPNPNGIRALYERIDQMSVEGQVLLSLAASDAGPRESLDDLNRALVQRIEGAITLRGNAAEITAAHGEAGGALMTSETRRHALALLALVSAQPDHPMAAPLVRTLLDARGGQGWESTQASAFALLALDAYRRAQEKEEPNFQGLVFLGNKLLGEKRFFGRSTVAQEFAVEMKALLAGGDLVFQQKGSGTLFYEARLKYARRELPDEPLESGFSVHKKLTPVSSNPLAGAGGASPAEGPLTRKDLVLVELVVVVPTARRFVVIDDPLPAGLEALDPSLENAQGSLRELLAAGKDGFQSAWHRSELRDDRVLYFVDDMPPGVYRYRYLARATTAGSFVTPPTRAMEMYQPEVYGRTAARVVTVGSDEKTQGTRP